MVPLAPLVIAPFKNTRPPKAATECELKQIPSNFTTDEPLKNMFWKGINQPLLKSLLLSLTLKSLLTYHTVWIFQKFSTKILREINFRDSLFVHSIDSTEFYVKSTLATLFLFIQLTVRNFTWNHLYGLKILKILSDA